jgi:N-carbamoyl-L-amino-acid hydrolase
MKINGDRLWASLMELAKIGATPKGGVKRLALTDLDKQGRDLVVGWARRPACRSRSTRSAMSSCAATARTTLPPVMTGSHIDTQPTGGKFDGNYGVLAGLEVVRTLNDLKIRPKRRSKSPSGPTRKARASCR